MEDRVESLKELKRTLLSLVCSNPARMDVNCLKRDFAETEREGRIPIHKYNYKDLIMFLNSECKDIFQFEGNPHNPFLVPIVTKEIKTLNELVVRQKTVASKAHLTKRSRGIPSHAVGRSNQWTASNSNNTTKSHYLNTKSSMSYVKPHISKTNYYPPESSKKPPPLLESLLENPKINNKVIDNLRDLIAAYSDGLWTHELMKAYDRKYNIDLPLERLGYNSVISLCKDLPQVFKVVRPDHLGDWRVFSLDATVPDRYKDNSMSSKKYSRRDDEEDNRPMDCEVEIFGIAALPGVGFDASLYPKDCAGYGVCLPPPPELTSNLKVLVAEVQDPSHFWFQVDSPDTSVALDLLMDRMDDVYSKSPPTHLMVRAAARVGQLCAVPYSGRYHRAVVVKNISYETVKVRYVDYGTVSDIAADELRMLLSEFTQLPVQAHRGRLAGVRPFSARWGLQARSSFLQMVCDKQLEAEIVRKDDKESVYDLKLFEWDNTSRQYIDAELLYERMAVSIGAESVDAKSTMLLYLLPTFLDLENGKFVNEEELEIESKVLKNMTVDHVTEGNIPVDSSQSLSKLQGKSDDGFQSHDDHDDYIQIDEELANQHREKAVDDMSAQSDIDVHSIPVLASEHRGDKVQFGNAGAQTVNDFLDVRTNLEPEIREIIRLSNLRNLSDSIFENKSGLPPDPRFFNGSHSEYLPPPYGYLNTNFAINQFMHNYPEQLRTPPNYLDMCRVPPNYLDMPRVPPNYLDMPRVPPNYSDLPREPPHHFDLARVPHMPPCYSELPRAQHDYSHMTRVSPSFPDLSRVPTGYPDFNHPRMLPNYALPYGPQGFYPNLAQTPQNRLCVPPPGFASHPDNRHSAANFALRPIIGQCHNTKPVRPPRFMSTIKPHSNSIQEVTEKLSDVSLFSSSISENSQNESNTEGLEKNNKSAKLNNLNKTDFSLSIQCRTDNPGDKNNVEANVKGEVTPPSISQSSNATNYTIDDSENDDDIYLNSSEYSLDLNGDSKLPWYKLELVDLADVAGHPVEVWHYKQGAYVILQQAASSIIDREGNRILVNSIVGCSNGGIEGRDHHIIQDEYTVGNIMRSIEKSGRTSYTLGQQVKIMTKKHISLEEDFIILVPLMSLLDVFCTVRENFLVEISDLMKFVISMLKKHDAEKSDNDSDSDD